MLGQKHQMVIGMIALTTESRKSQERVAILPERRDMAEATRPKALCAVPITPTDRSSCGSLSPERIAGAMENGAPI
ncbi:MAG: hypothetical protein BGP09_23490 [Rhizobium sp. 60-20]|nr:MAG: hypothetical protein BGP09_23490 [Rhizobium sp. 60-20]